MPSGPGAAALRIPTPQRLPAPRPGCLRGDWPRGPAGALKAVSPPRRPRAGKGGAGEGAPAAADPDASLADASARFPGSAEERRFGSDGPGLGVRPTAGPRQAGRAGAANGAALQARRSGATFSDASAASERPPSAFGTRPGGPQGRISRLFPLRRGPRFRSSCPIMQTYRTSPPHDKRGGLLAEQVTKRRQRLHHAQVIRADLDLLADPPPDPGERVPAPLREARASEAEPGESPGTAGVSAAGADPGLGAGERKGRGGRSAVRRRRRASLCSIAFLRRDPPAAGALRSRLALQSAAASAKILRLNADEAALRDLRFAVGDALGPAANLLSLWRDARRPAAQPRPRPDR